MSVGLAILLAVNLGREIHPDLEVGDIAVPFLLLGGPWLAGLAIRSRREREVALEAARVEEAGAAVADERARIARELHDAVAHSIGVDRPAGAGRAQDPAGPTRRRRSRRSMPSRRPGRRH